MNVSPLIVPVICVGISSFLVKDSGWQADTFSFRSHLPLKSGLLKGKEERNMHPPNVRASPGAGDVGRKVSGKDLEGGPRKTWLRQLRGSQSLTWILFLPHSRCCQ